MTPTPRIATRSLVLLTAALFCAAGTSARAEGIHAQLTQPFMIGPALFAAGEITVAPAGLSSTALSIRMDGRQVALAFKDGSRPGGSHSATQFVFNRDAAGVLHLAAIRYVDDNGQIVSENTLRVAAVSQGPMAQDACAAQISPTLNQATR